MLIMKIRLIIKFERTLELEARIYTIRLIMRIRPIIKFERTLELEAKLTCMIRLIISNFLNVIWHSLDRD